MYMVPGFQKIIGHSALEISKTKSAKMWLKKITENNNKMKKSLVLGQINPILETQSITNVNTYHKLVLKSNLTDFL